MFEDIMGALFNCLPEEHVNFCFDSLYPINPIEFGENVMFEFVKNAYFESLEKHSLRHYVPYSADDDNHSERMRYQRSLNYTQKYKNLNYNMMSKSYNGDPEKMKDYQYLLKKNMRDMKNKTEGYELSKMDVFEQDNIQNLGIIKSLVEQRLCSSKKVPNKRFIELFDEYDKWVLTLKKESKKNQDKMLFNSMAYFTLEWKYSLEFIYLVADHMERNSIKEADYLTLWALALPLRFNSRLGIEISVDNRFIRERQRLIPDFITNEPTDLLTEFYRTKYIETVGLIAIFNNLTSTEGGLYKDWFKRNTNKKDWVSFLKEFDVFSTWHKKEWTDKKITIARKLIKQMYPFKFE